MTKEILATEEIEQLEEEIKEKLCFIVNGEAISFDELAIPDKFPDEYIEIKIGRASCRERVCLYV